MRLTRLRRVASGGAALALSAGVCAVIGLSAPAGAVTNPNPQTSPPTAITYESDCTSTLQAGVAAPFVSSTVLNTYTGSPAVQTDNVAPTGATFGVAGAVTQTMPGALMAGLNAALNPATLGLTVIETFGPTDATRRDRSCTQRRSPQSATPAVRSRVPAAPRHRRP